ncbi:MAG: GDP-mannose 4,6-dehydratase [Candidatus Liptonbacteria bacterium]|nr:GDP-mannose 4,6-dehydratase [Candidatus Liptonbacteria bacterium]
MASQSKTVLITGGAGFVGSNVLAYFFRKYPDYHYVVLDALTYAGDMRDITEEIQKSRNFTFVKGDVRDKKVVDDLVAKADYVIHFAAETHVARSIADGEIFFETNVLGTERVATAVHRNRDKVERFIHFSTSEVYGTAESELIDENHPLNPQSPYAASKTGADRLIYAYHMSYQIPSVIIRSFNLFGPRQHPEKVIPRFITSRIIGEPLTVHGTGESQRDFTYVDDVARAIDLVLHASAEKVVGEVFNVGNGRGVSIKYIANLVLKMVEPVNGAKGGVQVVSTSDRPGQVSRHAADFKKIKTALGWQPRTTFEDGMRLTVDWYKQNRSWWEDKLKMKQVPIELKKGRVEMQ